MTIRDIQIEYQKEATHLGNYTALSKTELFNGYCDAEEASWKAKEEGNEAEFLKQDQLRSAYFAALMLRYWFKIFQWMQNSASLKLPQTDFVDWLIESFYMGPLYYKNWRYEYEAIVKHGKFEDWKLDENGEKIPNKYYWLVDDSAPDKIMNGACASTRGRYYQFYNKTKRSAVVHSNSLDQIIEATGDSTLGKNNFFAKDYINSSGVDILINALIRRGEGLEALIVDGIAYYDAFKTKKIARKVTEYDVENDCFEEKDFELNSDQFDPRKLVKHLNEINVDFMVNFSQNYRMPKELVISTFKKLKEMPNPKLYKYIEKTRLELASDQNLLNCLVD